MAEAIRNGTIPGSMVLINKNQKGTITPLEKLKRRILKQFITKKLIGDIIINDSEYDLLIEYIKIKYNILINSFTHLKNDPVFATALVQIGIRHYDGNYWRNVAQILGINRLKQDLIGEAFIDTLVANNKIILKKSERVNNILMHGFVSNYFANEMFDFLFKYYNYDLERDLQRNNKEMMNNLIELICRNDNTGRTYLLVKQTADAIRSNTRGGKTRIRHLLKLIDRSFWEQITPVNPISRLSALFTQWQESSEEFRIHYNKFHRGNTDKGKKCYYSPYIKCDLANSKFKLILPTQLIKFDFNEDIKWKIHYKENHKIINTDLYNLAITGYKTETVQIDIATEDIFSEFVIELGCNENRIRLFKIKADCIRFFDKDGDSLDADNNLPKGGVYSFTIAHEIPSSVALIETETICGLERSYFEFEYGDIIRLPDGKPLSIGKKIEEGLLRRKSLNGGYVKESDSILPIYCSPPSVLIKIQDKRADGTLIDVNGIRYRLFYKDTTVIDLDDRSGETGYIINLIDYGCDTDGIYTIFIDVPNARTNRLWRFALINGLTYEFEDAPYMFKTKGTIQFSDGLHLYPQEGNLEKNSDNNSYNFIIKPDIDVLQFVHCTNNYDIHIYFEIPVLKWRFEERWNVEKPPDIWHNHFPTTIFVKYPDDKIKISMDEQIDEGNHPEEHSVTYNKKKESGVFECDMTRFRSWFGRDKILRSIYIDFPKNRTEFLRVITRSVVHSQILKGDFESGKLIGEFDIVGYANYYADILIDETNEIIAQKIPLNDGRFEVKGKLISGSYKISLFEDEEDETGFGIANYMPIGQYFHTLVNPYDLSGKNILIKYIKKGLDSSFQIQLNTPYVISNLKRMNDEDLHNYSGRLMVKTRSNVSPIAYDVHVNFFNLNKLQYIYLTHFDGYDYLEFLYDSNLKTIVKEEEQGLRRAVRYRRYDSLYPEEYVYVVEFTDDKPMNKKNEEIQIAWIHKKPVNIHISDMGFSVRTYNCLRKAGLVTSDEIRRRGSKALLKVRNLGKCGVSEVIERMRRLGNNMDEL